MKLGDLATDILVILISEEPQLGFICPQTLARRKHPVHPDESVFDVVAKSGFTLLHPPATFRTEQLQALEPELSVEGKRWYGVVGPPFARRYIVP